MKLTKDILKTLQTKYSDINHYYLIIDKIEKNVDINPDIAIEGCKALIEGLSKFILKILQGDGYKSEITDKEDFHKLVKIMLTEVSKRNTLVEVDFSNKANKLIVSIGEIRNKRGDISHGKLYPKLNISDSLFSNLVVQMTDGFLFYIVSCFSQIEFKEPLVYDEYMEFNEWLDEANSFGSLSYSKALYDQDIIAYEQELIAYNESK